MTIAVHEKIKAKKAKKYVKEFAKVLGRIPPMFRKSVKNLHLHPGKFSTKIFKEQAGAELGQAQISF